MRLYICIDGTFAGTQAEANAKGKGWTQVEVPTDKAGLIDYLNGMVEEARAAVPYDGGSGSTFDTPPNPQPINMATAAVSAAHQSVAVDQSWEALPLARKLHFAALAMEDARAQL